MPPWLAWTKARVPKVFGVHVSKINNLGPTQSSLSQNLLPLLHASVCESTPFVVCQVTIECNDFCQIDSRQRNGTQRRVAERSNNKGDNEFDYRMQDTSPSAVAQDPSDATIYVCRRRDGRICVNGFRFISSQWLSFRSLSLEFFAQNKWHIKYTLSSTCDWVPKKHRMRIRATLHNICI